MLTLFRKKEVFMEQREHPRFALYQKTFFSSETDHLVNCEVYDISHSGLGFHTNISIENGTIVNILIYHKNYFTHAPLSDIGRVHTRYRTSLLYFLLGHQPGCYGRRRKYSRRPAP